MFNEILDGSAYANYFRVSKCAIGYSFYVLLSGG